MTLSALHQSTGHWVEAAETLLLCASTVADAIPHVDEIWRPSAYVLWNDARRSRWLPTIGDGRFRPETQRTQLHARVALRISRASQFDRPRAGRRRQARGEALSALRAHILQVALLLLRPSRVRVLSRERDGIPRVPPPPALAQDAHERLRNRPPPPFRPPVGPGRNPRRPPDHRGAQRHPLANPRAIPRPPILRRPAPPGQETPALSREHHHTHLPRLEQFLRLPRAPPPRASGPRVRARPALLRRIRSLRPGRANARGKDRGRGGEARRGQTRRGSHLRRRDRAADGAGDPAGPGGRRRGVQEVFSREPRGGADDGVRSSPGKMSETCLLGCDVGPRR